MTVAQLIGRDAVVPESLALLRVMGLTADSRAVQPGFIFAALPGTVADGNAFAAQALDKGAVAVVTSQASVDRAIVTSNPRRLLALMAARFHGPQPETVVAVTGTNGKTSVAVFVRQIWEAMGFRAASLGTVGVVGPSGATYLQHTTPDPVQLHAIAAQLREDDVKHLAIEASSHGLSQHRLDGLQLTAGAFTNLTHDHLDYHETADDYFDAKMRLFRELLPQGSAAVINTDSPRGSDVLRIAQTRGLVPFTVGRSGADLKLIDARREGLEQHLRIESQTGVHLLTLPLAGDFQVSNALIAAGLVIAAGGEEHLALHALQSIKGAPGRLEMAGRTQKGGTVFIDYAHTPDALETALQAVRPFAEGKLAVVFGCGGDRDKAKRPVMGGIAVRLADRVIVTDDNPRTEDAAAIRQQVLAGAKAAVEIGDRAAAIRAGVGMLGDGDILLVAGKGHEEGQIIGKTSHPFSDHAAVAAAIRGEDYRG